MDKKTKIFCDVTSCKFHQNHECKAETITVTCDNCMKPTDAHETACKSFVCRSNSMK